MSESPAINALRARLATVLIVASPAWADCTNDAGTGDLSEGEVCATDFYVDNTDGGCLSTPPVFFELGPAAFAGDGMVSICGTASTFNVTDTCDTDGDCLDNNCAGDPNPGDGIAQGQCVGPSEPSAAGKDRDWYLVSAAALAAADTDGNGVVQITSHVVSEFESLTLFLSIGNPACSSYNVLNSIGCGGPQDPADAVETVMIADHPNGLAVFVSPGPCLIRPVDYECSAAPSLNDYVLTITFSEPPTACADPAINPNLLPCNTPNPGVAGCEDPVCCGQVCEYLPLCCALEWSQPCAQLAVNLGCAPPSDGPVCIANGADSAADGYLQVCPDPEGGWADLSFGGQGDLYNPPGALAAQPVSFSNAFFMYRAAQQQRELLATYGAGWQPVVTDLSLSPEILCVEPGPNCIPGSLPSDTNNDGVFDPLVSKFKVTGAGVDLTFDLTQAIDLAAPPGAPVATLSQTYTIHNNLDSPIDFVLLRQVDFDLYWSGSFSNDSVGTNTNGSPLERYVFQGEAGQPATHITMSSPQGARYVGAKATVDPDGPGPGPYMGAGTDIQEWDAYGVPQGWGNFIAYVGYDTNGASGAKQGDAHVDLEIPVSIDAYATTVVNFNITYGAMTPLGLGSCPWDCAIPAEGEVNVLDFLAILAQWGEVGAACDIDGGGISVTDLLSLLGHWGACPP